MAKINIRTRLHFIDDKIIMNDKQPTKIDRSKTPTHDFVLENVLLDLALGETIKFNPIYADTFLESFRESWKVLEKETRLYAGADFSNPERTSRDYSESILEICYYLDKE